MKENEMAVHTLASSLQKQTGVSKLTVMTYKAYGRVFEVSRAQSTKLEKWHNLIQLDQTQAKTRYTHVDLQTLNAKLNSLEASYTQTQDSLFQQLCNKVMSHADDIMETAASLARLDVATSLGLLAECGAYTRPTIQSNAEFKVQQGLHPVLASLQGGQLSAAPQFISNDCSMETHRLWVVTGPNMGGKSTFLRQNALLLIMAQMGSFVPAQEAIVGVADRLFARVGASDNVARHMSTFHVEMAETASILSMATQNSFVVLDEIGRGTSATEGTAIARAVIEYLCHRIGCRCLVATHYQELGSLSDTNRAVGSYKLVAERDTHGLIFTYKVKAGRAEHSFGVEVARLAGMPTEVIERAKKLLQG
jgi:DNA mismatch repair protein MutS